MADKRTRSSVERTATLLALLGFVPFASLAALLLADPGLIPQRSGWGAGAAGLLIVALKAYAAVVLSFIGGIRWGVAIVQKQDGREESEALVFAAVPSLIGWLAVFMGDPWSFAVLAVAFAATGWWDSRLAGSKGVPDWFGSLRLLLTVLVMATMLAAFVATYQSA